jgi:hypothetical protein
MVNIAGFGQSHHGVKQQTALDLRRCAFGEFFVNTVHGIPCLKRNYLCMADVR